MNRLQSTIFYLNFSWNPHRWDKIDQSKFNFNQKFWNILDLGKFNCQKKIHFLSFFNPFRLDFKKFQLILTKNGLDFDILIRFYIKNRPKSCQNWTNLMVIVLQFCRQILKHKDFVIRNCWNLILKCRQFDLGWLISLNLICESFMSSLNDVIEIF